MRYWGKLMDELTPNQISAITRVTRKPELQPILFKEIKGLKWLMPLRDSGLLDPTNIPAPVNLKDGQIQVLGWPVLEYIVSHATELNEKKNIASAQLVWDFIVDATTHAGKNNFENYRVWWQFSKIIRHIPLDIVRNGYKSTISNWLDSKFDRGLVFEELVDWFNQLLDKPSEYSTEITGVLLDVFLSVDAVEKSYDHSKREAKLACASYKKDKLINDVVVGAFDKIEGAKELTEARLKEMLDIDGGDGFSNIWRRAISNHTQNTHSTNDLNILLTAYRDGMEALLSNGDCEASNILINDLVKSEYQVIQRVGVYLANKDFCCLKDEAISIIIDFMDDHHRHEVWHFLNSHFKSFTSDARKHVYQNINTRFYDDVLDKALRLRRSAYAKSIWLSAIKDHEEKASTLYAECLELTNTEPEHPDFSSYITIGGFPDESPVEVEELVDMYKSDIGGMVSFLNEYKDSGNFRGPSLEGLIKTFSGFVISEKQSILSNLDRFLTLKPHYLHEIFNVYLRDLEDKSSIPLKYFWSKITEFSIKLFCGDEFWSYPDESEGGAFIGNKNWIVGTYARLIEYGAQEKSGDKELRVELLEDVKATLEEILKNQKGEIFDIESDPVSIAINSPKGRVVEAYLYLALFNVKKASESQKEAVKRSYTDELKFGVEKAFDVENPEYEYLTLFANFYPNMVYLGDEWSASVLERVSNSVGSLAWVCAIHGFSYLNFDKDIYDAVRKNDGFNKIYESPTLGDHVFDHYLRLAVIAWYHQKETLDDDNFIICKLLNGSNYEHLNRLVWILWHFRNESDVSRIKELVAEVLPRLIGVFDDPLKESRALASKMSFLSFYIDELDEEKKAWLLRIAPFSEEEYNSHYLLESLAKLSKRYPLETAEVWLAMIQNRSTEYSSDEIQTIFQNLVANGKNGIQKAKEVAGQYLRLGIQKPMDWLNEVLGKANV